MHEQADLTKAMSRIAKLLAMAREGSGATEKEAEAFAERATLMMAEFGLTQAQVERDGGTGDRRTDAKLEGNAGEWWQPPLMKVVAATCYVYCEHLTRKDAAGRTLGAGYQLIGREEAVATCRVTYEYLVQTVRRCCKEYMQQNPDGIGKRYMRGMSGRLQERIDERHRAMVREQKAEAEARNAAAAASGNTSTALVLTLVDYQQREKDLNNDMRMGWEPGTTAARREKDNREMDERRRQREAKLAAFIAEGIAKEVADLMCWGYSRKEAEERIADEKKQERKPVTDAQARKMREEDARRSERRSRQYQKEYDRKWGDPSYRAGERRGNEVSLDKQVDKKSEQRKLT